MTSPGREEWCVGEWGGACLISCINNNCQEFKELACSESPNTNACIAAAEQVCTDDNGKGKGKGKCNGKGKGNGKSNGKGNCNGNGEISCSQCQAIIEDYCEVTYPDDPERVEWCVEDADYACQAPCNNYECQNFSQWYCSLESADSVDACNADVEQACLN